MFWGFGSSCSKWIRATYTGWANESVDLMVELAALPFCVIMQAYAVIKYRHEISESRVDLMLVLMTTCWTMFWGKALRPVKAVARFVVEVLSGL